ncbi:hypothetical protein R6Q57_019529 [Mikania cordata]
MDGRRITASPRPCNGRRVVAKKRPRGGVDGFVNSVKKLQRREICSKKDRGFRMCDAQERFRNIRFQEEYDTHDPKGHCSMVLPFLKKRSKIIEIVAAHDIVFALAQSGVCAAFSRETNKRICFLNVSPDEVIRSLFYNKNNDSLITVSVYASDSFSSLKCRTTRIEYIWRGQPDAGFALFESESLKWPGFVEFDDVNGKVRNSDLTEVSRTEFMTPSAFIFLYENQLFLTFRNRTVAVWNFRGELVTSFEDHLLWHPDCNTNNIYITSDQDLIISYCKTKSDDSPTEGNEGSINISNILTGKCLAKIEAKNDDPFDECSCSGTKMRSSSRICKCTSRKRIPASRITSSVTEALEDITALFYDEERNEIYTGNRLGFVHVWSN